MKDNMSEIAMMLGVADVQPDERSRELELAELYDCHSRALFRYAHAITRSTEDAEDAVQEVFIRIARESKLLRRVENVRSYLYMSTRNAAYEILRRKHRRDSLVQAMSIEICATHGDGTADLIIQSEVVRAAFLSLPVDQREVLVLKVYDEMSFKEIAEMLKISINTAASRYRYGLTKLREALEVNNGR